MPDDTLDEFNGICRLFPLPGVVLLPHAVIPLHIFEPRYRRMMEDALRSGDGQITMVLMRGGESAAGPEIADVACLGRVIQHHRLPDGRFNLLLRGMQRVRLLRELERGTLYRQAEAELIREPNNPEGTVARRGELIRLFRRMMWRPRASGSDLISHLESGIPLGALVDLIAHALDLPAALKQEFLAEPAADHRANALIHLLRDLGPPSPPPARFPPRFSDN